MDERIRRVVVQATRDGQARLVAPTTAVIEFVIGHRGDPVRAARVLRTVGQLSVTPEVAARAAWLLLKSTSTTSKPSVIDGTVAALGETYGTIVTADVDDMTALAAAGTGFEIYAVPDLLDAKGVA